MSDVTADGASGGGTKSSGVAGLDKCYRVQLNKSVITNCRYHSDDETTADSLLCATLSSPATITFWSSRTKQGREFVYTSFKILS